MSARARNFKTSCKECIAITREPIQKEDISSGRIYERVEKWLREIEKKKKRKVSRVENPRSQITRAQVIHCELVFCK